MTLSDLNKESLLFAYKIAGWVRTQGKKECFEEGKTSFPLQGNKPPFLRRATCRQVTIPNSLTNLQNPLPSSVFF
jgi:hypothetical protein